MGIYADLMVHSDGAQMVLPLIGSAGEGDANSLFVTRSEDWGTTWADPTAIVSSEDRMATLPEISVGPEGRWHLLWVTGRGRNAFGGTIRHSTSEDGGKSWKAPSGLTFASAEHPIVGTLQGHIDPCGTLHALVEGFAGNTDGVYHLRYSGNEWISPRRITREKKDVVRSRYAVDGQERLHLVWLQTKRLSPRSGWPPPTEVEVLHSRQVLSR